MNFSLNSTASERHEQGRIGFANLAPTPAELLGVGAVESRKPELAEDLTGAGVTCRIVRGITSRTSKRGDMPRVTPKSAATDVSAKEISHRRPSYPLPQKFSTDKWLI